MAPFLLPPDRAELLRTLSAKSAPHGDMMALPTRSAAPAETQRIWSETAPTEGEPLILYVHVPFCVSRCAFCGFYSHRTDEAALEDYTRRLLVELGREADRGTFTQKPVDVVYFGGGTPTALSADQLRRVIGFIYERFNVAPDVEFTVEGRLYAFDDGRVRACLESGVTRFSFGVQSFETELRRSLGRRNSREEILGRLADIKALCGDRIALVADLIYGLPGQTQEDWMERNVRTAHESALDGVDLYSLKVFPGLPLAQRLEREGNWGEEERAARHAAACDWLAAQGWRQLSCTHWGRNALERNRYNHWAKTGADIVPFGCGAGGFIGDWSFMQTGDLEAWRKAVDAGEKPIATAMRKPANHRARARFTDQMERGFLNPADFPDTDFSPLLENWEKAGVWSRTPEGAWRLTRLGEYCQTKLSSLLAGFAFASQPGALEAMKAAARLVKLGKEGAQA